MTDYKISRQAGATGGAGLTAEQTTTFLRKDGVYAVPSTVNGVQTLNGGSSTAASAPVLTPSFASGTAAQLADTTRDYLVYLCVTTPGTANTLAIGPTSTPANTIMTSQSWTAGQMISFRLPAGWYVKWSGTTTAIATQTAIGC